MRSMPIDSHSLTTLRKGHKQKELAKRQIAQLCEFFFYISSFNLLIFLFNLITRETWNRHLPVDCFME